MTLPYLGRVFPWSSPSQAYMAKLPCMMNQTMIPTATVITNQFSFFTRGRLSCNGGLFRVVAPTASAAACEAASTAAASAAAPLIDLCCRIFTDSVFNLEDEWMLQEGTVK